MLGFRALASWLFIAGLASLQAVGQLPSRQVELVPARLVTGEWQGEAQDVQFRLHSYRQTWDAAPTPSPPLCELGFELRAPLGYRPLADAQSSVLADEAPAQLFYHGDDDAASYFWVQGSLRASEKLVATEWKLAFASSFELGRIRPLPWSKALAMRDGALRLRTQNSADRVQLCLHDVLQDKRFFEIQFGMGENHLRPIAPEPSQNAEDALPFSFEACAKPTLFRVLRFKELSLIQLPFQHLLSPAVYRALAAPSPEPPLRAELQSLDLVLLPHATELSLLFELHLPEGWELCSSSAELQNPHQSAGPSVQVLCWGLGSKDGPSVHSLCLYCPNVKSHAGPFVVQESILLQVRVAGKVQQVELPLNFELHLPKIVCEGQRF